MNDERLEVEQQTRSLEALRLWRRFFAGLQIRERVQGYEIEGEDQPRMPLISQDEDNHSVIGSGGGFIPDQGETEIAQPTAGKFYPPEYEMDDKDETIEDSRGDSIFEVTDEEPEINQEEPKTESDVLDTEEEYHTQQPHISPRQSYQYGRYHLQVRPSVIGDIDDIQMQERNSNQAGEEIAPEHPPIRESNILNRNDSETEARASEQQSDKTPQSQTVDNSIQISEANQDSMQIDSESDSLSKGSLLSHDPEDDEADPEWLYD